LAEYLFLISKKSRRFVHGHFQNLADILCLTGYGQDFRLESLPVASGAKTFHITKKVHANGLYSGTLAVFTTATLVVETENAFTQLCLPGSWLGSKQTTDGIKQTGIGSQVATWSAPNGTLINGD